MSVVRDVGLVVLIGVAVFLAAMSVNTASEVSDLRRDNAALVAAVSVQDEILSELQTKIAAVASPVPGVPGPAGPQGPQGERGTPGTAGAAGTTVVSGQVPASTTYRLHSDPDFDAYTAEVGRCLSKLEHAVQGIQKSLQNLSGALAQGGSRVWNAPFGFVLLPCATY